MYSRSLPSYSSAAALLLLLSARSATGQGLDLDTLKGHGLVSFANAVSNISSTPVGQSVLAQLSSGSNNYTVFAPTDAAFSNATAQALGAGDANSLASIVAYHIAAGSFANHSVTEDSPDLLETATWPSVTVARSLLDSNGSSSFVNLEAGKGQACIWARSAKNGSTFFWDQAGTSAVNASQLASNILLVPINGVLAIPGDLNSAFERHSDQASSLSGLLSITNSESSAGSLASRFMSNSTRGFTLFAPNNDAIKAAGNSLTDLTKNETAVDVVLGNHYVNGSTFYSTQITNSTSLVSASGQAFKFTTTSNGTFVTSGNVTAKIVEANVLVKNGVVHFIDQVLLNTNENESAAQSAYQSATSTAAAGASSTVTGPIGESTSTSTSTSSSGGGKNGANGMLEGGRLASKVALGLAMIGGLFFL